MFLAVFLTLLTTIVVVEAFALLALMRQVGTVLRHVAPPRPGTHLGGPEPGDDAVVPGLSPGRRAIVLFLAPNCPTCRAVEPALVPVSRHYDLSLVTVLVGGSDAHRAEYVDRLAVPVRTDLDALYAKWEVPGTPFAVGIDEHQKVLSSGIVNSLDQLETLAEYVLSPAAPISADDSARLALAATNGGFAS